VHRVGEVGLGRPERIQVKVRRHKITQRQGHILPDDVLVLVPLFLQIVRQNNLVPCQGTRALPAGFFAKKARTPVNLTPNTPLSRKSYISPAWPSAWPKEQFRGCFKGCQLDTALAKSPA